MTTPTFELQRAERLLADGFGVLRRLQERIDATRDPIARAALQRHADEFAAQTALLVAQATILRQAIIAESAHGQMPSTTTH
ncbi:MAG: hypothetical protein LDL44_00245 [Caenispirillum sp.]|nr:hypothetical protein [Caenispirillum sp.]